MSNEAVPMMKDTNLSGREFIQAVIDGEIPYKGIAEKINMRFTGVGDGTAEVTGIFDDSDNNFMGTVHGGNFATILDTAMGNSVMSKLSPGQSFATVELDIKLVRPIPHDKKVIAKGEVRNMSRQIALSEGVLEDENGKLIATGSCLCMVKS